MLLDTVESLEMASREARREESREKLIGKYRQGK
jgi:hypothetical protein